VKPRAKRPAASAAGVEVQVGGHRLVLKNLDKVFYPEAGFTKRDVIDYYARIAPVLVPHLRDRALTMKRYPEGVDGMSFYEKRCPKHRPAWVHTEPVWSEGNDEFIDYCVVNDLPTLMWAASIANLELHTSLSFARAVDVPTVLVFDLDPGPPADVVTCCSGSSRTRRPPDRRACRCTSPSTPGRATKRRSRSPTRWPRCSSALTRSSSSSG
jgi:bifunctional non-homologous end joining protein LigD